MLGAGATPDESLRTHDVLGDQRRRESEEGVAAFLRQHLTAEEFAAVQPHLATHGWTTCRRLAGVTIEDLVKPTGDAEAERGLGLSVGAARLIHNLNKSADWVTAEENAIVGILHFPFSMGV